MGLLVVIMSYKFPLVLCHPLEFLSTFVSCLSFDVTTNMDHFTMIAQSRWWFELGTGRTLSTVPELRLVV